MEKLAKFIYGWLLEGTEPYSTYFTNDGGWLWCFIMMAGTALLASSFYYYVLASKVSGATKDNYIWTWIFGYIVLFFFTPLVFQLFYRDNGCDVFDFWTLFVYIGLLNALYYTLVYELFSYMFCSTPWTKAKNIHLFTVWR